MTDWLKDAIGAACLFGTWWMLLIFVGVMG
jgi:cbb3-type cytochrome oxidase subunit 3